MSSLEVTGTRRGATNPVIPTVGMERNRRFLGREGQEESAMLPRPHPEPLASSNHPMLAPSTASMREL